MLTSCVAGPLEHFEADPDPRYYLLMDQVGPLTN